MRTIIFAAAPALAILSVSLLPVAAQAQSVRSFSIDFNDVTPGTSVNTFYQATTGATFELVNNPVFGQVVADNPGFLLPPGDPNFPASPTSALNAVAGEDGSSVRYFDSPGFFIRAFSFDVVVDPQGFGQTNALVSFLGANGLVVSTLTIDQTIAGSYSYTQSGDPVAFSVILPGDALYDNIRATVAAPEPTTLGLLAGGLIVCSLRARRRK